MNHQNNSHDNYDDEISPEELRAQLVNSLEYLIAEGLVVEVGGNYRLKTKKEIRKELRDIEDGNF
jgi:hypothetical protein